MAVLAISALGAAAGAAIGGTFLGVTAASWGWMAGSMLGNALFAKDVEGPRLGDLRVTGSEYGQPVPWVAGSPRIAGQIIWASQKRETATSESAKGGPEVTTYTYDCDLVILLTENEIAGVSRIWLNSELVYGNGTTKAGIWSNITVYTGAEDQMPDPVYEAAVGAGNAPAYRGRGYVVIQGLQLGGGGQLPNLTFEVGTSRLIYEVLPVADVAVTSYTATGPLANDSLNGNISFLVGNWSAANYLVTKSLSLVNVRPDGTQSVISSFLLDTSLGFDSVVDGTSAFNSTQPVYICRSGFSGGLRFRVYFADGSFWNLGNANSYFTTINRLRGCYDGSAVYLASASTQSAKKICRYDVSGEATFISVDLPDWVKCVQKFGNFVFAVANSSSDVYVLSADLGELLGTYTIPGNSSTANWIYASSNGSSLFALNGDVASIWSGYGFDQILQNSSLSVATLGGTQQGVASPISIAESLGYVYSSSISGTNAAISTWKFGYFGSTADADLSLSTEDLLNRAGYDLGDYDLSELSDSDKPLRAMAVGQVAATRGALESLQTAWFFEASKSDKIYIRPRAETAVATIPWADLGCAADPATGEDALSLVLANDLEVPAQVALSYPSMEQDYQTATEHSDRIFSGQESTQTIQLGIGMTAAEAKGVADAIVFDLAASQTKTTLRVPLKYAYIEPGDIVNAVNFDGRTYRVRVQTKRDTLSIIELECVLDDVGALRSAGITDGDYLSITDPVTVEQTEFEALDIPILRDADNSPGYYMAVGPVITNPDNYEWKGAQVVRSWNGTDYAELFQTTGAGILGTCSNTLGNWTGGNVYDETNALTVVTTGGELSSRTREAMQLDGTLNVAAVGSHANGWEIIRFRNATLTAENTYILTGLHRGFRGTEWAMDGHGSGEQFVLLDSALRRVTTQTSQIGLERFLKAATFGLRLADVTEETFTDTGVALKPFAPANPVALADGADVVVTWQRRTRVSYVYGGATPSVPVGENIESYRVRIFDGSTLVRTEVVLSPEYTYAAADIASDGFATSDTITFEICQISEIVGAGYPAECEGIAP